MNKFLKALSENRIIISDGAMGTELQKLGMEIGSCPEELNLTSPGTIATIHKNYVNAGAEIIGTNTFGANSIRLKFYNLQNKVKQINEAAVTAAKEASNEKTIIAGSIGPLGEILEPLGELTEAEAYIVFKEQASSLVNAGADFVLIETMMALEEIELAVKAAKEFLIPVAVTMSFEKTATGIKTQWGVDVKNACKFLENLKIDAIGANCGKGFDEMADIASEMKSFTSLPVIAQSNAGLPEIVNGSAAYNETPEYITSYVRKLINADVKIIGGCCGTTPDHIKTIKEEVVNAGRY